LSNHALKRETSATVSPQERQNAPPLAGLHAQAGTLASADFEHFSQSEVFDELPKVVRKTNCRPFCAKIFRIVSASRWQR
jgi:hypothetical protein